MMRVQVVLNGCTSAYLSQAKQIEGFVESYCNDIERGATIIISNSKNNKAELLKAVATEHVEWIWVADYQVETVLAALSKRIDKDSLYIFGNDESGTELAVRAAARTKGASAVNVNMLEATNNGLIIGKPLYSNHMQGTFLMKKTPCCISIAKGMQQFEPEQTTKHITDFESDSSQTKPSFLASRELTKFEKTKGLEDAKLVIAAGLGISSKEAIADLELAAEKLHGMLGVSRPVAMNAWVAMDKMIGVSGAMLSPQICITAGVSGAAAFFAGIAKSNFIIAINTDERAPIMKKADVAITGDYKAILEELLKYMD